MTQQKSKQTEIGKIPEDWQTKILGDVGNIFSGNSINEKVKKTKYLGLKNGMPYVATKDISYENDINYENGVKIPKEELNNFKVAHKNSIFICAEGGSAGRKLAFNVKDVCFVNKLFTIETHTFIEPKYIYYFYQSEDFQNQFKSKMSGLIGGVSLNKFKDIEIKVPSLKEQKTIVKILDEVFESISKSKENAEKNLKNTKELFESYLEEVFSNPKGDWEEKKLGEVLKLEYGKPLDKKDRNPNGKYPVYGANGEKNRSNKFYYDKNSIIVGRKGSAGEINLTEEKFWPLDVTYFITFNSKKYDLLFLYYLLKKLNLPSLAKGVKPGINRNEVYSIDKHFPKISEQTQIVQKLDALSEQIKQLEEIYKQKVKDLEELKKSMLQKAFSGELTKE